VACSAFNCFLDHHRHDSHRLFASTATVPQYHPYRPHHLHVLQWSLHFHIRQSHLHSIVQNEGWGLLQGMTGVSRLSKRWPMISDIGSSMWLSDGFSMPSFNASIAQGFRFSTRYLLQMTSASSSQLLHPLTNDLVRVSPSIPYTVPVVSHTSRLIFNISLQAQFQLAAKRAYSFIRLRYLDPLIHKRALIPHRCATWRYVAWSFRSSNDW